MIEFRDSRWHTHCLVGGELVMQGEWPMSDVRVGFSGNSCEMVSATDNRAQVVALIAEMRIRHESILDEIREVAPIVMNEHQLTELESMHGWLVVNGRGYFRRVQEVVYLASQEDVAVFVERVVRAYQRMARNLVEKLHRAEGNERARAGMHVAEWLSDTPARLAFRLHRFGLDISRERIEGKASYVVNKNSADSAVFYRAF